MRPASCEQEPWFRACKQELAEIQEKVRQQTEREEAEANRDMVKKFADHLDKIRKESDKGTEALIRFLYAEYVPVESKVEVTDEMLKAGAVKKTLMKLSLIFHPDKNVNETKETQYFRGEIQKFLGIHLEKYK